MRFVTFRRYDYPEPGVLVGDEIIALKRNGFDDLISVIAGGEDAQLRVAEWMRRLPGSEVVRVEDVRLTAPIPRPPKIVCVGLNYRDHAAEAGLEIPDVPTIFSKFPTAVIGPDDPIVLPRVSTKPDYEAELAFVIGRGGRHIPGERWREHVFGYTCFNDVSARDFQMATTQWVIGKSFDTFAPMGPWLVTADEVPDPHALDISLTLGGEVMQSSNTQHLIFKIPELIEHLSAVFTLEPGDVISDRHGRGRGLRAQAAAFPAARGRGHGADRRHRRADQSGGGGSARLRQCYHDSSFEFTPEERV